MGITCRDVYNDEAHVPVNLTVHVPALSSVCSKRSPITWCTHLPGLAAKGVWGGASDSPEEQSPSAFVSSRSLAPLFASVAILRWHDSALKVGGHYTCTSTTHACDRGHFTYLYGFTKRRNERPGQTSVTRHKAWLFLTAKNNQRGTRDSLRKQMWMHL